LTDGRIESFGNPARELRMAVGGDVLADLSHTGLIKASGEDAVTFLQGQLTNDVQMLSEQRSQLAAYCSPKGRVLVLLRLFKRGEALYLMLPSSLIEPTLKRLRMYVLRSKVTLQDASAAFIHIGCSGPGAAMALPDLVGAIPPRVDEVIQTGALTILRVPGIHPRFEVLGEDLPAMQTLWTGLSVRAAQVGANPWRLLDIGAGVPQVYAETQEAFVPQMMNLDPLNAISYRKGCYTGQEIVARTHYLGKLKRRMYRAMIASAAAVAPGTEVFTPEGGESVGKVVEATPSPEGGQELLAVLQIESAQAGELRLGSAEGPRLRLLELPYSVD
jgi:folate-binding protein YgfZ